MMKKKTKNLPLWPVRRPVLRSFGEGGSPGVGGSERGQSLILALLIMFLLVFLGGVFVALIARNLGRTQRSSETLSADYLAEAGIRYASDQLTYSEDGADWRPVPSYPEVVRCIETGGNPYLLDPLVRPDDKDPDLIWLMQGYSRFTYGKGRFLIRVTYNPKPHDPTSKYIKIESLGRVGIVEVSDPTTLDPTRVSRLRAERVAFKAIGITDYSRFITNKDRRPGQFSLGVPGFNTQFGDWKDDNGNGRVDPITITRDPANPSNITVTCETSGGSIRVNGDLLWHGRNDIWVNPLRNEDIEVAGDIQFEVYGPMGPSASPNSTRVLVNSIDVRRSADPAFNTLVYPITGGQPQDSGLYRDGRTSTDENGWPRNIVRLDPPLIDVRGPAGGVSRYRELTRNSGEWLPNGGEWFNTGFYGWGAGIYINNRDEIQTESNLGTLQNEWVTPGSSQYWVGPYYIPPGVLIILTPHDLNNDQKPDMILIRSDATPSNPVWYDQTGKALTTTGGQMIMPYPKNGVIFAEGNVRIKGTLPPGTQLTVVSGGTIYVEGSILRYPYDKDGKLLAPNDARDSSIALLATDNVCVNTTQFFGPMAEGLLPVNWQPDVSSFIASVSQPLYLNWAFGADPTQKYVEGSNKTQLPVCVYVRHAAAGGDVPCYMNMSINQFGAGANPSQPNNPWWGLYLFGTGFPAPGWNPPPPGPMSPYKDYIYPLADLYATAILDPADPSQSAAEQKWPMWEHQTFTLSNPNPNYTFYTDPGVYNSIGFHLDQNYAKGDYLLSKMAIQPCDIRIEALLYAQNGCFFVIPGDWFNPDTNDIENGADVNGNKIPDYRDPSWKRLRIDDRWPFYGQPLDCKITILGAISENIPAPIAEANAWMEKWGWIPPIHGCSPRSEDQTVYYRLPLNPSDPKGQAVDDNGVPIRQQGLTIIYDSSLSCPPWFPDSTLGKDRPVREDAYRRPLPLMPKLPVSPETLYFGRPT